MKINQQMSCTLSCTPDSDRCLFLVKTNDNSVNSDWNDLICKFER